MNKQYVQFGQGLCGRGNSRPSIDTAGLFERIAHRTGGAWGAPSISNYTDAELNQRHFLMRKSMSKPTIDTKIGLSTQQRALMSQLDPDRERPNFLATTGTAGFYREAAASAGFYNLKPNYCVYKGGNQKLVSIAGQSKGLYTNGTTDYSKIRNAINKCSTNGFYKKKKKSSKHKSRRRK